MNRLFGKNTTRSLFIVKNLFLLLFTFSCFLFPFVAHGDDSGQIGKKDIDQGKKDDSTGVGFTVEPVLTQTQVDPSKGYFFIQVEPGQSQTLTFKVKSTIKEPRTVRISVKDAYTNQNGAIDYDGDNYKRDKTLVNSLEDLTAVSTKKVTVEKLETKEVSIDVQPPSESFEGVKMAAICAISDETDSQKDKEGLSSIYGYRVGLVITEQKEIEIDNGASLNFLNVKPTVHHGKRVIQTTLQNPEPKILKNLSVETKLRKKGTKEVLRKRTTNNMRVAPNSQFDFATNWGLDPIEPGTYVLTVKADSGEKKWKWEKEFTIGEEEAKKINEQATYTISYPSWVPIVVVLLGVATLANIGSLYVRRKRWTQEQ
ncbi:DUF916 and DUF3324 domain-containing protein [Enterococcus gilvus]|uniref:DUF916 and DUF3324 domain-containing protein n=1 Tax=Enterococcus gilvus TaxID=160453 RepID=UPI003D6B449B